MSTITTLASGDNGGVSRTTINTNFSNLNTDKMETSVLDTDTTLAANSDAKVATQKAVKAYIDAGGDANLQAALAGGGDFGTPSGTNKFITENKLSTSGTPIITKYLTAGSPHTWTKPTGLKYIVVEVQAAGGGGGGAANSPGERGSGGGGGGYSKKQILASALGATETVTVGAGGAGSTTGTATTGGSSSFGSHATATGGTGGTGGNNTPGDGGVGSSGDLNLYGQRGLQSQTISAGDGGHSFLGGSVAGVITDGTGGNTGRLYGGGGGGGGRNSTGGTGAAGIVIVTEYYV